jgi:predicted anti-sigma-YlaC factor YlaD
MARLNLRMVATPSLSTLSAVPRAFTRRVRAAAVLALLLALGACSPRLLLVRGMADGLAAQGQAPEDDLVLAREASAFYLKLSESLLQEVPDHLPLSQAVASGFTQYAYAFVAFEAERIESRDSRAAQALRARAARLYARAQRHALAALERSQPGFRHALESTNPMDWPALRPEQIGLAYWGAASWGALISLSKDSPDTVADLPLAVRLAQLAYAQQPGFGQGALAGLMASFESARPGGSSVQALRYFDQAIALGGTTAAGPLVAKAEGVALPAGDRAGFEALLQQALAVAAAHPDLQNAVMLERAHWLLATADDLF